MADNNLINEHLDLAKSNALDAVAHINKAQELLGVISTVPPPGTTEPPPPTAEWEPTPGMTWSQRFTNIAAPSTIPYENSPANWASFRLRARVRFGNLVSGRHVFILLLPSGKQPWPLTWEYNQERAANAIEGAHASSTAAATGNLAVGSQTVMFEAKTESANLTVTITRGDGRAVTITDSGVIPGTSMAGGWFRFGANNRNVTNQGYVATEGTVEDALLEVR